ncbi:GTP-binding protein 4-like [Corticium candelabrum]|uniref:GTP-binding protein 4-like n=1 Tax=Corticium candelabrum TaxID=121492 RepID=UPI002E272D99|nr:GTP-binding protein 4-like [Corticium candelabrum]
MFMCEVRQHLSRLPSIDPLTRTLLICGFPNVGKSSFINKLTRADVEVQPYAFTTKSLYVGHMDYKYLRWQVVDTPGILDHPLDERNTIEMQAITALAHLRSAVVYVMDISEQCGHSVAEQVALFNSIGPLFVGKPLVVALNKVDIIRPEEIDEGGRQAIETIREGGFQIVAMSTVTEEGLMEAKSSVCESLLAQRVEQKMKSKKIEGVLNRLHLATPQPRDNKDRPPFIPAGVNRRTRATSDAALRVAVEPLQQEVLLSTTRKLEKDIEREMGDEYTLNLKKYYLLTNEGEKYDAIPEMWEGKNISDFIDPEIMEKLEQLEREETLREAAGFYDSDENEDESTKEVHKKAEQIRQKKRLILQANREKRRVNRPILPRRVMKRLLSKTNTDQVAKSRNTDDTHAESMEFEPTSLRSRSQLARKRKRELSGQRSLQIPRDRSGLSRPEHAAKAKKLEKIPWRQQTKRATASESDRRIYSLKPKHLLSGKRGIGKTQRR